MFATPPPPPRQVQRKNNPPCSMLPFLSILPLFHLSHSKSSPAILPPTAVLHGPKFGGETVVTATATPKPQNTCTYIKQVFKCERWPKSTSSRNKGSGFTRQHKKKRNAKSEGQCPDRVLVVIVHMYRIGWNTRTFTSKASFPLEAGRTKMVIK